MLTAENSSICAICRDMAPNNKEKFYLCHHNIHEACFESWAKINPQKAGKCPFCLSNATVYSKRLINNCQLLEGETISISPEISHSHFGFKQCPRCRVWIEKVGWCRRVLCRCGLTLCFNCISPIGDCSCRRCNICRGASGLGGDCICLNRLYPSNIPIIFSLLTIIIGILLLFISFYIIPNVLLEKIITLHPYMFLGIVGLTSSLLSFAILEYSLISYRRNITE